jgi:hypothetical protein
VDNTAAVDPAGGVINGKAFNKKIYDRIYSRKTYYFFFNVFLSKNSFFFLQDSPTAMDIPYKYMYMYLYTYVIICVHIWYSYTHLSAELNLNLVRELFTENGFPKFPLCIYVCVFVFVCACTYMFLCIY